MQYIHFEPVAFTPNKIKVSNRHDFIGLEGYTLRWAVECDGKAVQGGEMDFPVITPESSANIELPLKALPADGKEYFLTLRAFTKHEAPLIPKGHEVAIPSNGYSPRLKSPERFSPPTVRWQQTGIMKRSH